MQDNKHTRRDFIRAASAGACALCIPAAAELLADKRPGKFSKEAMHYYTESMAAFCDLCPTECIIRPGKTGDCLTRKNIDGILYTIAYGNPCAVHVDPIEKKPLYHFLPSSRAFSVAIAGCVLSCKNCQNWTISQKSPSETRNYDLMPDALIRNTGKYKCESIAYTYSEPVAFYEYTLDSAKLARQNGIKNVLVSCGYSKEKPMRELAKYIDAANIDLKSFDEEIYKKLNAGHLQPILNTLEILKEENVWLEITNLIVPQWTDEPAMIKKMCKWLVSNGFEETPLHFSRFHPMYKLEHLPPTPIKILKQAREIALEAGMKYAYIGNVPDSGAESTFCPSCSKRLIHRQGFHIHENLIKNGKCPGCGSKIAGVWN